MQDNTKLKLDPWLWTVPRQVNVDVKTEKTLFHKQRQPTDKARHPNSSRVRVALEHQTGDDPSQAKIVFSSGLGFPTLIPVPTI